VTDDKLRFVFYKVGASSFLLPDLHMCDVECCASETNEAKMKVEKVFAHLVSGGTETEQIVVICPDVDPPQGAIVAIETVCGHAESHQRKLMWVWED